jgi:hypothetical protein
MTALPDRLPLLSPGAHLSPDDGACLMELVSVLAGARWSDTPACTDPTLATVARVVNDEMSDPARQHLAILAAELVGRRGDPARLAPAIVAACLSVAAAHVARPGRLHRHQRRAARQLQPPPTGGPADPIHVRLVRYLYARGPAQHAITAAVVALRHLPPRVRDAALRQMLDAATAATPPASAYPHWDGTAPGSVARPRSPA